MSCIDLRLPDELRAAFAVLGTPAPLVAPDPIFRADLGAAASDLLQGLGSTPIATSAFGPMYRSTLPDGTAVAVKVLHPGIREAIARELSPTILGGRLAAWFHACGPLDALAAQLRDCVLQECDYTLVAQRQECFWWLFASHPTVVVPAVRRSYSSARVLTAELVSGAPLDRFLATQPSQETRDRAGEALFDFYLGALFQHGLYHCDPHPANHLFLDDGRLAFVDFGAVRELEPAVVTRLAALTHSLFADDRSLLRQALVTLGMAPASGTRDEDDGDDFSRSLLRAVYGPLLRDEVAAFDVPAQGVLVAVLQRWRTTREPIRSAEPFFLLRTALGLATLLGHVKARANWHRRLHTLLQAHPQPRFDVVLLHPGQNPIPLLRELRDATGLPLREIEHLMKRSPQIIKQAIPRTAAEALRSKLEKAGAQIEIRVASGALSANVKG